MLLKDIGEFGFIKRVSSLCKIHGSDVIRGIGDDCAVIRITPDENLLITTDMMVERIHFRTDFQSAPSIGAKALAVNLSDIAACGGTPGKAFVSIAVPERFDLDWLEDFYRGMAELAQEFKVDILGGDTTSSLTDLVINILVTGFAKSDEVLLRNGAQPGDIIALSGNLGNSAAGLQLLRNSPDLRLQAYSPLINEHMNPRPHLKVGRILAKSKSCNACIDVSDGLSSDLGHICEQSGLGAIIFEETLPMSDILIEAAIQMSKDPLEWVLNGGEDYVILAAIRPDRFDEIKREISNEGSQLIEIGEFVSSSDMKLVKKSGTIIDIQPRGWNHFRA